jgi:hypothetical protein
MESLGTDEKRVAVEAIATLCYVKVHMVELLLKPAGVPEDVFRPLLDKRDEAGRLMSKREIAPLLLDACQTRSGTQNVVRRILEIAGAWSNFHLANDEYAARAVVHKAREVLDMVETMEAREAEAREMARQQELARMSHEKGELLKRHSDLLLMMFEGMARSEDPHGRGYLLQELMNRLFDLHEIPVCIDLSLGMPAESKLTERSRLKAGTTSSSAVGGSALQISGNLTVCMGKCNVRGSKRWAYTSRSTDGLTTSPHY